jgi:hypothetical protein
VCVFPAAADSMHENTYDCTAHNVSCTMHVDLSALVLLLLFNDADSSCSNLGDQEVICTWASLPNKAQRRVTIIATAVVAADTLTNSAAVTGDLDSDPLNNNDTANVTVTGACCAGGRLSARSAASCSAVRGSFFASQNVSLAQSSRACGAPTGACCRGDGKCVVDTQVACTLSMGKWRQGAACLPISCAAARSVRQRKDSAGSVREVGGSSEN